MQNKYSKLTNEERGFTLIELIIVIVILGILASVALPKFIGISDAARLSAARGVGGAMSAAISALHTDFLVNGNDYDIDDVIAQTHFGGGVTVTNAGNVITFSSGGNDYVWDYTDKVGTFAGFLTEDSSSEFP